MWDYTDKVKDHFLNPRNVGEVAKPSGTGEVGSLACGDALTLTFELGDDGKIADAKFKTFGCASAIASSSALTEMIMGLTLEEAEKISNEDLAEYLGGLPKEKMHCSVMGREALEAAIANYRGVPIPMAHTKAGGGCGNCHDRIQELIVEVRKEAREETKEENKPKRLTNIKKIKMIEDVLEREIRPALRKDGGDIELIDVDGDFVMVSLRGACVSCAASQTTLKDYVEKKLREQVLDTLVVEEEKA